MAEEDAVTGLGSGRGGSDTGLGNVLDITRAVWLGRDVRGEGGGRTKEVGKIEDVNGLAVKFG